MVPGESSPESFIIRIWSERAGPSPPGRHGYLLHVPDPERHYFRSLGEIPDLIAAWLPPPGRRPGWGARVRALRRCLRSLWNG